MNLVGDGPVAVERILAIIPKLIKPKPFRRDTLYALVVTDQQSIFARITDRMLRDTLKAQEGSKRKTRRLSLWWTNRIETFYDYGRYLAMKPDEILRETADNFAIENSKIKSIAVKPVIPYIVHYDPKDMMRIDTSLDEDDVIHEIPDTPKKKDNPKKEFQESVEKIWELRIETERARLHFSVDYDPKEMLKRLFPDKIL